MVRSWFENGQVRRRSVVALVLVAGLLEGGLALAKRAPPAAPPFDMIDAMTQASVTMNAIDTAVAEANAAQAVLVENGKMAKLEEARDVTRLLEKLIAMAQRSYQALQQAVARSDAMRAEREYVKITVAYQRILDIVARLKAAAGTTATATIDGSPEIDLVRDADLPTSDPGEDIGLINTLDVDTGRPPATTPIN